MSLLGKTEAYELMIRNCSDITLGNYISLQNAVQTVYSASEEERNDCSRGALLGELKNEIFALLDKGKGQQYSH